ncbi:hypothetical protein B0J13DRAFT_99124 [Dactylonectria estremocensis]|uniref:Secreted protein n=1 Tax=Dactylonectria estremocensis TaxID=1079267 RepID=A0A9P9IV06_9HYPO|nr:hypothetical protein B0J13DRAFT_99124 [Dactylonectria estremocensis]
MFRSHYVLRSPALIMLGIIGAQAHCRLLHATDRYLLTVDLPTTLVSAEWSSRHSSIRTEHSLEGITSTHAHIRWMNHLPPHSRRAASHRKSLMTCSSLFAAPAKSCSQLSSATQLSDSAQAQKKTERETRERPKDASPTGSAKTPPTRHMAPPAPFEMENGPSSPRALVGSFSSTT